MISLKTKYAIKALIALAEAKERSPRMRIEEIAARAEAPKCFASEQS